MRYTGFNKATVSQFRTELNELLSKYANESGLDFKVGTIRFSASNLRFKVETNLKGTASVRDVKAERAKALVERMAKTGGLTLEPVMHKGQKVKLIEYHTSKPKYPYIYEVVGTGKRFKTSEFGAKVIFAR